MLCNPYVGSTIELLELETGARRVLVSKKEAFPSAMSLSYSRFTPDERHVVFAVGWEDHTDPAFVNIETGDIELVDAPGIFNTDPVVSPDGRWILVSCEGRQFGAGFQLCLIDRRTGRRNHLIDEVTNLARTGEFTPDGRSVVYTAPLGETTGQGQLFRIDLESREKHLLVSGLHSTAGILGVNSTHVAFTCTFPERPACYWVCVVDLEGRDVRRLTYLGENCRDSDEP
jgi:Tol biopolymer transport system component